MIQASKSLQYEPSSEPAYATRLPREANSAHPDAEPGWCERSLADNSRKISGVRLCWELEEPKGPKGFEWTGREGW